MMLLDTLFKIHSNIQLKFYSDANVISDSKFYVNTNLSKFYVNRFYHKIYNIYIYVFQSISIIILL